VKLPIFGDENPPSPPRQEGSDEVSGSVAFHTSGVPCLSCVGVAAQFKRHYPRIRSSGKCWEIYGKTYGKYGKSEKLWENLWGK